MILYRYASYFKLTIFLHANCEFFDISLEMKKQKLKKPLHGFVDYYIIVLFNKFKLRIY